MPRIRPKHLYLTILVAKQGNGTIETLMIDQAHPKFCKTGSQGGAGIREEGIRKVGIGIRRAGFCRAARYLRLGALQPGASAAQGKRHPSIILGRCRRSPRRTVADAELPCLCASYAKRWIISAISLPSWCAILRAISSSSTLRRQRGLPSFIPAISDPVIPEPRTGPSGRG